MKFNHKCAGLNRAVILTLELVLEGHLHIDIENIKNLLVPRNDVIKVFVSSSVSLLGCFLHTVFLCCVMFCGDVLQLHM